MTEPNNNENCHIELRFPADPVYLSFARQATHRAAELSGMTADESDAITLAIEEALTNVIRHSYGGPCSKLIIIKLRPLAAENEHPEGLEIIIQDFGKIVDPKCIQGRDLDDIRPGGLGVHIIRSVMDSIVYDPQSGGGMTLTMKKYVSDSTDKPKDSK